MLIFCSGLSDAARVTHTVRKTINSLYREQKVKIKKLFSSERKCEKFRIIFSSGEKLKIVKTLLRRELKREKHYFYTMWEKKNTVLLLFTVQFDFY